MKGYAYISNSQTLHVVEKEAEAKKNSLNGKIAEINFPYGGGYPILDTKRDIHIIVDTDDKTAKVAGQKISWEDFKQKYPAIYQLVQKLL